VKVLFLDESGDHNLSVIDPQYPMFVLGGVIMEVDYAKGPLTDALNDFKRRMLGRTDLVLHTADIVRNRNGFERMKDPVYRAEFLEGLNELMRRAEYRVVACAIHKSAHLSRYGLAAVDPYMLSLDILVERFCLDVGNVTRTAGRAMTIATMDAGYAYAKVFRALEDRGIEGIVSAKAEPPPGKVIPTRRFKFDALHNLARCPRGKVLNPKGKLHRGAFQYFHASARDCGPCPLQARCVSPSHHARVVAFNVNHPALLRTRRKRLQWGKREHRLYQRHRWRVEGVHGEAKTWHGLARAVRRGLDNMCIQAFLTAAAINLKRLAAALLAAIAGLSTKPLAEIGAGAHAELNLA